jgi:cyclic-di-AMP phosphodiesterase PgpH
VNIFSYIQAKHNLILKTIFALAGALILASTQPQQEVKGHKVDAFDAVWPYKDLVLQKDLLLKKSEAELTAEYANIKKQSPIFLRYDAAEKNTKLLALEALAEKNKAAYQLLKPLIDTIFAKGIIETIQYDSSQVLFLKREGVTEQIFYQDFFSLASAISFLEKSIPLSHSLYKELREAYPNYLSITHFLDREKTEKYLNERLNHVSLYKNMVQAGDILVRQGEALTNDKRFLINRYFYQQNLNAAFSWMKFFANSLLFFVLFLILLFYLAFFRKNIFGQNRQVFFLFFLVICFALCTWIFYKLGLMLYAIPFCLVPILVRVFFDGRTALFTHLIAILACSFFMADKLEFILLQLVAGMGTLFAVAEMRKRQQLLNSAFIMFLLYCGLFAIYQLSHGTAQLAGKLSAYLPFAISSTLVLLGYPLIYLSEKIFGFISDFKLLELCDLNQPLLRRLSQEVPGTFQHSLQVANLAEEAIYYIGGNTLLVRTGAIYHDIGKLQHPKYFAENQTNGFSPHFEKLPIESAKIIIDHVIKGVELAKKHDLPEQIIDFIRTHHGTTYVGYFLNLYKKETGPSSATEHEFRYPGPIPFSKETAVLMLADGVEAASRSLKQHDALAISDLVDNIIDYKISQNQLSNSDITFRDITLIKKIFKKRLMNIYHVRIEYPAQG